ncbi:MAG: SidJ-related pseudokinase [Desulfobacterales bacterium]|nr:SidJ-related pseudokinase [Desulfobacterales bacterium]
METNAELKKQRGLSEETLKDSDYDFMAKFMAVCHLQTLSQNNPEIIDRGTINTLKTFLKKSEISKETQAYFMYKEVANTLCALVIHSDCLADEALTALNNLLGDTIGHPHRAAAEALGSLPFSVFGPDITSHTKEDAPFVNWRQFLEQTGLEIAHEPCFMGRSLVAGLEQENSLLVIKLARAQKSIDSLFYEPLWMDHLLNQTNSFPVRFHVPEAIKIDGSHVFKLRDMPVNAPENVDIHPMGFAIGFIADKDYFSYPNEAEENQLTSKEFREVIFRNAWLLGKLTSLGVVHSAPIPLFHNRVQMQRRRDNGLYEWFRSGRLDRWLESCSYPNLGITGIRDFEHLISFKGNSRQLYRYIGSHILSLLLVIGSYFRNKDRTRIGLDDLGKPVDARDLFDKELLVELIQGIFLKYYYGFVSDEFKKDLPIDLNMLASRMIEEMGVDSHMEEILRIADQTEMTDKDFRCFLEERGYSAEKIKMFQRGREEITIYSGPHLGEFNHQISLPELINSVETMSALCIAGKYCTGSHELDE